MAFNVKTFASNLLLVVVSVIFAYAVLDVLFFRVILGSVQWGVRPHLPETAGVIVQSTKAGRVPHVPIEHGLFRLLHRVVDDQSALRCDCAQ